VEHTLSGELPAEPGPLSEEPGAPILLDRSREELKSAKDVLADPAAPPG
jgi:hypothetical protein